jgi:hypothetical protein
VFGKVSCDIKGTQYAKSHISYDLNKLHGTAPF